MKSTSTGVCFRTVLLLSIALISTINLRAQAGKPGNQTPPAQAQAASASNAIPVIKATTHLVTVDVVVTDHRGNIIPDLTTKDFQVFEQVPGKKGQREQKISQFEFVTQASAGTTAKQSPK